MQPFPHHYTARTNAGPEGEVTLGGGPLPPLPYALPAEFDGPGDQWSPESLTVGAIAGCFVLTFRAVAGASRLPWLALECDVSGTVDRVERTARFVEFAMVVSLEVADEADAARAGRVIEQAKERCLITNSLKAPCHLTAHIEVAASVQG
jgi:organic hydroperoxide reductase OsmC/OhrA